MDAHIEREFRYLVERPSPDALRNYPYRDITQTYLPHSGDEDSRRVRKTVENGIARYYFTAKRRLARGQNLERETEITEREYLACLADGVGKTIEKRRYLIPHHGITFELDVYAFAEKVAIAEAETDRPETEIALPPFLKLIRNITDEKAYSNAELSRALPDDFV